MYITLCLIGFATLIAYYVWKNNSSTKTLALLNPLNKPSPPIVPGSWPFIGHGLSLMKDPNQFFTQCYATYGPVFQVNLFRNRTAIFCGNDFAQEILKSGEADLSFYANLERIFIFEIKGLSVTRKAGLLKKATGFNVLDSAGVIRENARKFVDRLRTLDKVEMHEEVLRYVTETTVAVLIPGLGEISKDMVDEFTDYNELLNSTGILMRLFPPRLIKAFYKSKATKVRPKLWSKFHKIIEEYKENKELKASPVLRAAVDTINDYTNQPLTNHEISIVLLELVSAGTKNTALLLLHTLLRLAKEPKLWEEAKSEALKLSGTNSDRDLASSEFLGYCAVEAARLNSNILTSERLPQNKKYVGDYYVGDLDVVAVAGSLNHISKDAENTFPNALEYNPHRYLVNEGLPKSKNPSNYVMSWGAGVHVCSGKQFALAMIKVGLAEILLNYKIDLENSKIVKGELSHTVFENVELFAKIEQV